MTTRPNPWWLATALRTLLVVALPVALPVVGDGVEADDRKR